MATMCCAHCEDNGSSPNYNYTWFSINWVHDWECDDTVLCFCEDLWPDVERFVATMCCTHCEDNERTHFIFWLSINWLHY